MDIQYGHNDAAQAKHINWQFKIAPKKKQIWWLRWNTKNMAFFSLLSSLKEVIGFGTQWTKSMLASLCSSMPLWAYYGHQHADMWHFNVYRTYTVERQWFLLTSNFVWFLRIFYMQQMGRCVRFNDVEKGMFWIQFEKSIIYFKHGKQYWSRISKFAHCFQTLFLM